MSSSVVDIQIVSTPNLEKIENYLNDSSYRESIEYSANFNTRLCIERRLRLPFLDPQTGVAQNHSQLFMDRRQRMPGFREGQIYSYPSARWRKGRRQYLSKMLRPRPFGNFSTQRIDGIAGSVAGVGIGGGGGVGGIGIGGGSISIGIGSASIGNFAGIGTDNELNDFNGLITGGGVSGGGAVIGTSVSGSGILSTSFLDESSSSLGAGGIGGSSSFGIGSGLNIDGSDSRDGQTNSKDDIPKEWFFDDMDLNEIDALYEPKSPADDEYDYDPRYGNKKRKKRKPGRKPGSGMGPHHHLQNPHLPHHIGDGPPRKGRPPGGGRGRGRRKNANNSTRSIIEPPSPTSIAEPPSFETAAAAVEHANDDSSGSNDLRSYRKYLC